MADLAQPYEELAAHYDQIFGDWEASIVRQATIYALCSARPGVLV